METPTSQPPLSTARTWKTRRRVCISLAALATLVAVVYVVENWRGRRAWEACKLALESKGWVLEWSASIPPSVPDDENIYKAPRMTEWFVGRGGRDYFKRLIAFPLYKSGAVVAHMTIGPSGKNPTVSTNSPVFHFHDSASSQQAARLVLASLGPFAKGRFFNGVVMARPLEQMRPSQLMLQSDQPADPREVARFFPENLVGYHTNGGASAVEPLQIRRAGENQYDLILGESLQAEDYLAWSEQFEPDFDLLRNALKRPCARIEGDYQQSISVPCPNFLSVRTVSQALVTRTQCQLLLGHPEKALQELTLLHDLRRLLTLQPSGKPIVLLTAMIDVAVTGLYADTVAEGLRLGAWREPQLAAIQNQLAEINLPPEVRNGLACEAAGVCWSLENLTVANIPSLRDSLGSPAAPTLVYLALGPRGLVYRNLIHIVRKETQVAGSYDITNQVLAAGRLDEIERQFKKTCSPYSPYTCLAASLVPVYSRAWQTCAKNQTLVNQALIACALERCRLAEGRYPETLDQLVPRFAAQLPHDIIGGQPFHYKRDGDSRFRLYSVGWNEADDGGAAELDWVWNPASL
jgi:hypothetical protein